MKRKLIRWALIALIFVAAVGGAGMLAKMKPPPEKKENTDVDLLVQVMPLGTETVNFTVRSQGNVRPRTETVLSAEVSGAIVEISPKFIPGGVFAKNEVLMRIDPTNYRVAVDQAEAVLAQRQIEYDGALKLRKQGYRAEAELASAAAALETAKAELVRARRNLELTAIRLPYEGMVRSKDADLGQYVTAGSRLGVAFATDFAEVRLPLTDQDLAFVDLPSAGQIEKSGAASGPEVILSAVQRGKKQQWTGKIVRSEGVVDENTRVTYAVVRIEDPYRRHVEGGDSTPLPVGTFVSASIAGNSAENVIRVPRSVIRGNGQIVVVNDESRLEIRDVDILRSDAMHAYLSGGVAAGERIAVTSIENPINGMRVRTGDEKQVSADEESADETKDDATEETVAQGDE
jgi:RND family efflux transporter MFP subunit